MPTADNTLVLFNVIKGITDLVSAKGKLEMAPGGRTTVYVFIPDSKEDAARSIGMQGKTASLIRSIVNLAAKNMGQGTKMVFRVDDSKVKGE